MKTITSTMPGKIEYINGYSAMIGVVTRNGERFLIPAKWSEAESLEVVVHTVNGQPISLQDLSTWANILQPVEG